MKKTLIVTLALVFVLGLAGTAFANPYSDVPAGHWAYKAVMDLQKAGIMEGAGGKFMGNQTLTRYEIAAITARAMAKADKADAAQKATIDKLAVEFSKELNDLGVRVAKLEKSSPNIKIGGESRLRWTKPDDLAALSYNDLTSSNAFDWRQRLHLNAKVSDNISYTARIESTGGFNAAASSALVFNRNFFTVKDVLGIDTFNVGRFGLYQGNYLAVGKTSNNDGINFATKVGDLDLSGFWTEQAAKVDYKGAFISKTWKDFSVNVGYLDAEVNQSKAVDVGLTYAFAPGVHFVGEYVDTNNAVGTADAKAWAAQLSWSSGSYPVKKFFSTINIVDVAKAGEQGVVASYRVIEANGIPGTGQYGQFGGYYGTAVAGSPFTGANFNNNVKAMYYGYQNVLQKNVLLNVEYQTLKTENTGAKLGNLTSAYVQFFF